MPRPRLGIAPMTPAERQVRHRARRRQHGRTTPTSPAPRIPPRPRRWAAAVAALVKLQDEYRAWLDNLPPNLEGSRLAEKLQAIAELDLDELHTIDPPRGYGWRRSFLPPMIVSTLRFPPGSEPSPHAPRLEISCESARPARSTSACEPARKEVPPSLVRSRPGSSRSALKFPASILYARVLPGHGNRICLPRDAMREQLQALVERMQR